MTDAHRFVAAGVETHVLEWGSGPALVLLHGFTGSAEAMAPFAEALASRYRVVAIDLVGHGRSATPADEGAYTMENAVRQVIDVVDHLRLSTAHVVGYSMGGRVGLATAVEHPDRVRTLTTIGATAGIDDSGEREARQQSDRALADRIEANGIEWFVETWMALPIFASQERLGPVDALMGRRQRLANSPVGLANSLRGMGTGAQPSYWERLGELRAVPVQVVVGEEDAKFVEIGERLLISLPTARMVLVPDAGHAAHLENEATVAEAVRGFAVSG